MATITKHQVALCQGDDEQGRPFGYVAGDPDDAENDGGFFFTWHGTLEDTLASVEVDEIDGAGGLVQAEVVEFLRGYLPRTMRGKALWAE